MSDKPIIDKGRRWRKPAPGILDDESKASGQDSSVLGEPAPPGPGPDPVGDPPLPDPGGVDKRKLNTATLVVLAIALGLVLPLVGYMAYANNWFAPANEEHVTDVPPDLLPQSPTPTVDRDAVIAAVRSMGTYVKRSSGRADDIDLFRDDIRMFDVVGGDSMKIGSQKAEQRIEQARTLVDRYHRSSAQEAALIMGQARLSPEQVNSILDEEKQEADNKGYQELEDVAVILRDLVANLPSGADADEGRAYESLESLFPRGE